ncbi:class I SAM-dependent methyltransferase [Actinoallomurus spadix]|uniref:Methyltransferase type 11 domain-containing protein n=1 Tax=Actinoallomurus spadix TaxID=79912 RepID=A0ABN0VQW7_9ACTN|nr:class I SAM-dependent methyltransferase [Actinoallomurus spadix]MCO5990732.1 class I SAM-dependent methyltransferase [Actinoallomurus spadix]
MIVDVDRNPFARHPLRRYAFSWQRLAQRDGRHLDVGCGDGYFLSTLQTTTRLECSGADPHPGYLEAARHRNGNLRLHRLTVAGELPFDTGEFDSVSLLDVLEHVPDESRFLDEVHRVLSPGGLLVLTVPRRHIFSFLDPDNAKFRFPRLHRFVYTARFGRRVYRERFVDLSDDLRGDMSVGKHEHTNYRPADLIGLLRGSGFEPTAVEGANLFWRWLHAPALLTGGRLRALLERLIYLDGVIFKSANIHVAARRVP